MPSPSITIVMPAYNAAHHLPKVLPAAIASAEAAGGARIVLVDPGSSDETAEVARGYGVEVLCLGHRAGPALARNRGVERVDSEVVLFIDSDCVCHPDVVARVRKAFEDDPALVSLTGSYCTNPPEPNFFSQYMNLRHHFVHQRAQTEGATFWAGCGAVRTSAFRKIGGFDAEQFPMPMIEDIELSLRLRPEGNARLDPALHVTHLKRWTARGIVETEIKSRAIPWGKLILETGELPNDLNLSWSQRIAAGLAPFALFGVVAAPTALLLGQPLAAAACATPLAISFAMHWKLFRFFQQLRGTDMALRAYLFHQVHLTYSATTMALLTLGHLLEQRPTPARASGD